MAIVRHEAYMQGDGPEAEAPKAHASQPGLAHHSGQSIGDGKGAHRRRQVGVCATVAGDQAAEDRDETLEPQLMEAATQARRWRADLRRPG